MSQTTYRVDGMTCSGCERSLRAALERAAPRLAFTVSHDDGTLVIEGVHDPEVVKRAVDDAGFDFEGVAV